MGKLWLGLNRGTQKRVLFLAFAALSFQQVIGEPHANVEVIEPFSTGFLTEKVDFYVRVTNTGEEAIRIGGTAQHDLFFELGSERTTLAGDVLELPTVENAKNSEAEGLLLPEGRAYVLSDADYNEADLIHAEAFTQVRVHVFINSGNWVSSDWIEREILPAPDLNVPSLCDYKHREKSLMIHSVVSLPVSSETWLFSTVRNSGRVGRRLCRVPDGRIPTHVEHDADARRLTIRFDGEEEVVVINTRTGLPVSGSERTVPHLHLWRTLAGRPFTDFYQQSLEAKRGGRESLELSRTTVAAMDSDDRTPPSSLKEEATDEFMDGEDSQSRVWLVAGVLVVAGAAVFVVLRRGK